MTQTGDTHTITLEQGLATFLDGLAGKNRSGATISVKYNIKMDMVIK